MSPVAMTNSATLMAECQTDPIMVPFPLPAIGRVEPVHKATESVSMQTEYTWMFNEFPTRSLSTIACEREVISLTSLKPVQAEVKIVSPKKKQTSVKKVVPVVEEPKKVPTPLDIPIESLEMEVDSPMELAAPVVIEPETQAIPVVEVSAPVAVQDTPKKRSRGTKKELEAAMPATPATSAGPETPGSTSSPVNTPHAAGPQKVASLRPILSDSSDDECALLNKATPLTRTITPVSMKPSVTATPRPKSSPVQAPQKPAAESGSESDDERNQSSSSDSDAGVPSASLIGSAKRKQPTKASPKKTAIPTEAAHINTRLGPLVQVENADESHIETIYKNILDMIPEPLRNGAIKEAVADEANKRLIFQLRITPKVVQFIGAAGGVVKINDEEKRNVVVLSEVQKKKAANLFKASTEEEQAPKRRR